MILSEAWQSWKKTTGVAVLAVLAFGVGIGSATAIFTVINGVMLRPLPYPHGDRFVALYGAQTTAPGRYSSSTFPDLIEYQQRTTTSFDAFGWFEIRNHNLSSQGEPQYLAAVAVTPSLAHNLGVSPAVGRWFTDDSGVVISNRLWRRLGGSPSIVGTAVTLDGRRLTITGVMPSSFRLPIAGSVPESVDVEAWTYLDPVGLGQNPRQGLYFAYARRKPGVSLAQAQADAKRAAAEIAARDPASHPSYTAEVVDLREKTFNDLRWTLLVLFGAAGLLLLISCANVATLLLARSVARARETAIRVALGASRLHLALRYFVEGSFVSLAGAALGVGLGALLVRTIALVGSEFMPPADEIAIDWKVLSFGLGIAFLASALASLAPLWQAVRTAPNAVLTEGVRASAAAPVRRISQSLVVAEIALAFTLLAVSAILILHMRALGRVAPGFNPDNLLTFQLALPDRVATSPGRVPLQARLVESLERTPGVTSAAFMNQLPTYPGCLGGTIHPEGRPPSQDGSRVCFVFTTPGYPAAMGVPLQRGRFLTDADRSEEILFAAVNQTAVNRYWPDLDPVGAYGRLNRPDGNRFQVVGVVGDVHNDGLNNPPEAEMYLLGTVLPVNPMEFVVRSVLPPAQLVREVRRAVGEVDRTLAVHGARTMSDIISDSLQLERVSSLVMSFFALAALLMATLGIYGVMSYSVRQRTVEMGTRMALGAVGRDLLTLVVGSGLRTAAVGLVIGAVALAGAVWLLMRLLSVRELGWLPFVSSTAVVALVATAASCVPAWRASRLSPMVAIRDEPETAWQSIRRQLHRMARGVRQMVASDNARPAVSTSDLLAEFVTAARGAESFTEALQRALATVCARLNVESAALMELESGQAFRVRCSIGDWRPAFTLPASGFVAGRLAAYPLPLPFTPGELDALIAWAAAQRPERLAEIELLRAAGVRLAVPIQTRTEITGVILLHAPAGRDRHDSSEKQLLGACAGQFALMMENARLTGRVVEQETLRRDLALAADIQRQLLPMEPPVEEAVEFVGLSLPARSIGGDYYDFIRVGEHQIGIALADVSGKGIAAALIMSAVQASLRIISSEDGVSLPQLVERMNHFLYRSTPGNKYVTFFYAQYDSRRRQIRYVNAGHNPPYLVRSEAAGAEAAVTIQELAANGTVVGLMPGLTFEESSLDLRAGDVLVAFTDGVTEAHNPQQVEFGEERLKDILRATAHLPAADICARISAELKAWIEDADQYDDLTCVVMKLG